MPHALDTIPQIPAEQSEALKALGYESLEQFVYAAQVSAPELASYLGVSSIDALLSRIPMTATAISDSTMAIISTATYSLGVDLENIPRLSTAPSVALEAPTAGRVNHIPALPPIRHQGQRGTCVAHAALAVHEHYLMSHGAYQDLAEQFLYWNCKINDRIPQTEGTYLGVAFPLLQRDGCCVEAVWPYNPGPVTGNEGQGPPPGGAQLAALTYRLPGCKVLSPTSVTDLKSELARERCVAFSIPVFNSWYRNAWVAATGDILMPVPGEVRAGGHAMCLVGYQDMPQNPELGGGRFIVRNSWGATWGIESPFGAGYGTIPYAYLSRFGTEAYTIT